MTGIYIHVPFCIRKCPYCAFYSVAADDSRIEGYMSALKRSFSRYDGTVRADTIYFGGGTPSLLEARRIADILNAAGKAFELVSPEIALECNPCTVDMAELYDLRQAGVNRLSVGVQSLDDGELGFLGRLHDADDAKRCIACAAEAGFENISADLMIGIKGQSAQKLRESVRTLTDIGASHISAYMIKTETGTVFDSESVRSRLMNDDDCAELYLSLVEACRLSGLEQYEISNFAKPGFESRHNIKYWTGEEYIGFGPSAHSFCCGRRTYIPASVDEFISSDAPRMIVSDESPDPLQEYVMLGLRLSRGISLAKAVSLGMPQKNRDDAAKFAAVCADAGLCCFDGDILRLTPKGMLVSNSIITELLS